MTAPPVIAIDGPVGSGKGTIARRVAKALQWHLLDSGALYRLVALAAYEKGLRKKLIWLVYVIPTLAVIAAIYLLNFA